MQLGFSALVLLASASTALAVEFKFAPPDGLECDQHYKSTVVKDFGDAAPRGEDAAETVARLKYEKTAQGYRVRAITKSNQSTRDGKPLDDPMTKLMIGREIIFEVGPDGALKHVEGYEKLAQEILAMVPPDTQKTLAAVLNAESLQKREIAEWNGRIAAFVGKRAEQGDVWEAEDDFPLPSGSIKLASLTRFSKIEMRDGRPMVTINFAYAGDAAAAKKLMDQTLGGVSTLGVEVPAIAGQPTIQAGGERVVDANTMNIERETLRRVIRAPFDLADGQQALMVRTETKEYVFKCNK